MNATLNKLFQGIAVLGFAALSSAPAFAGYLTFFGEDINGNGAVRIPHPNSDVAHNNFLNGLVGVGTETFEGFSNGQSLSGQNLNFGIAGNAVLSGGNGVVVTIPSGTNGAGRYPISGNNYYEVTAGGGGNFTVTFDHPGGVAAFGFFGVDIGDFGGTLTLTLANGLNTIINVPNTQGSGGSTDGSVLYFGLIGTTAADQFTSVTFNTSTGQGDVFAFDDLTVGSLQQVSIPEPASLALIGLGLAAAGFARRRKS